METNRSRSPEAEFTDAAVFSGPLADEACSRARSGVVERIYNDGIVVAERHRCDNRRTMAVLTRPANHQTFARVRPLGPFAPLNGRFLHVPQPSPAAAH
jgi:hypothetical protein